MPVYRILQFFSFTIWNCLNRASTQVNYYERAIKVATIKSKMHFIIFNFKTYIKLQRWKYINDFKKYLQKCYFCLFQSIKNLNVCIENIFNIMHTSITKIHINPTIFNFIISFFTVTEYSKMEYFGCWIVLKRKPVLPCKHVWNQICLLISCLSRSWLGHLYGRNISKFFFPGKIHNFLLSHSWTEWWRHFLR